MKYKFRGKRLVGGWVGGYLFQQWGKSYIMPHTINGIPDMVEVIHESVGQFIGLPDKNGVEICQGDIIKVLNWCTKEGKKSFSYIKVEYQQVFGSDDMGTDMIGFPFYCGSEVIGNVYDNPELLKKTNVV